MRGEKAHRSLATLIVVALALLVAACSPAAVDETTTPSPDITTTSQGTTSTSSMDNSSTTTMPATTTTLPAGTAIVLATGSGVLGTWEDGRWVEEVDSDDLMSGMEFVVFPLGSEPSSVVGGDPEETCNWVTPPFKSGYPWMIPLDVPGGIWGEFAVSSPWKVEAGHVVETDPSSELVRAASDLLAEAGIEDPSPTFSQTYETDFDDDGLTETLVSLDRDTNSIVDPATQPYGMAFIVGEGGEITILGEVETVGDESGTVSTKYIFLAVMDVNADGVDEVGMATFERWSSAHVLYAYDGSHRLEEVLGEGCSV